VGLAGWDLISLEKHLPWQDVAFVFYLVLVVAFSLPREVRLAWHIWFFSSASNPSSHQRKVGAAGLLAANALAGKLPSLADSHPPSNKTETNAEAPRQVSDSARASFDYLWEKSVIRVAAMKNLAVLTLILSGLVLSHDLMNVLPILQAGRSAHGDLDIAGGPAEMLVPVILGLAVSAVLYCLSSFYFGALARRRAEWNLFVAQVNSEPQPRSGGM
jgi:hypothetical protein